MSKPNISAELSNQVLEQIKSDLGNIKNALPFLVNLNSKDRRNLLKMGPASVSFVEEALNISKNHSGILPSNFNITEFEKDVRLTAALTDLSSVLIPLAEGLSDTLMSVGSEAMAQANIVYAQLKISSKNDSNMDDLKNRLGARYKKTGIRKAKENKAK